MYKPDPPASNVRRHRLRIGLLIAVPVATVLAVAIGPRILARSALKQQTQALAVPTVSIVTPQAASAMQTLDLPASIQAFQDAAVYARTSGYVQSWKHDIGSRVAAGDVLATIASPEVDDELAQAKAAADTALADYTTAKSTADRWQVLAKTDAVSQQDVEQTVGAMQARKAALAAARANVARLSQLREFAQVRSPFNGVVTSRGIDTGSLIDPGSAGGPKTELFHVMQTDTVRVFVDVPQNNVADIRVGTLGTLTLAQWPERAFQAQVTRSASAIDPTSRTLRVELDVPNPDGALLPGAYGMAHLRAGVAHPAVAVPVSALVFRPDGVQVATVNEANRVSLQPVTLGRDFGTTIEVTKGLEGRERVIANPTDGIASGDPVRIAGEPDHV